MVNWNKERFPGGGWWTGQEILPMRAGSDHGRLAWEWVRSHPEAAKAAGFSEAMTEPECRIHAIRIGWVRFRLNYDPRSWRDEIIRRTESFNCDQTEHVRWFVQRLVEHEIIAPDALVYVGDHRERLIFKGSAKNLGMPRQFLKFRPRTVFI